MKHTIWIINQYAGSPQQGMEYRHYYLARALQESGHRVIIISGSYSHLYTKLPEVLFNGQEELIDGITYVWLQNRKYDRPGSLARVLNMRDFVSSMKKLDLNRLPQPDTILVSSPSLFPIVQARKWARKYQAKLIFEVRDIWPLTLQYLGGFSKMHPLILYMRFFEKYAYAKSDAVISVLPGLLLHTGNLIPKEKFTYIPNGIFIDENNTSGFNSSIDVPAGKFVVTYVGTIGKSNALEYLIDAARVLENYQDILFLIVGDGAERNNLEKRSSGLSNVIFTGSIDKREVPAILSKSDCNYIGWHDEPLYRFGISANKLYDYLYSGKPVIHSVNAYNDCVKESGCGISVAPCDVNAIAEALLTICQMEPAQRTIMGEKGKEFVLAHHTYHKLAEKLLNVIEKK